VHNLRCVLAVAPVAAALALPAAAAAAIDPGVNYDPGSPAGKEYAIPLVQGRADGAGTENQRAAANTAFGVGITPPGGGHGAGRKGHAGAGKKGHAGKAGSSKAGTGAGAGAGRANAHRPGPSLAARILKAAQPQGTGLLTVGMALAVLLASAALAVALRRRPQDYSH
jgi:hypothetical protein